MKLHPKNRIILFIMALLLFVTFLTCLFRQPDPYSMTERRKLAQFPKFSVNSFLSGEFMKEFEIYTLDQFPLRDSFRTLKAMTSFYIFHQADCNGIYLAKGYASQLEYPLNEEMLLNASDKFSDIYETCLKDTDAKLYFSIVPDKNYFLAAPNGYLSMDYDYLISTMRDAVPYMEYIDLLPYLSIEDYYKTDTHWRQECILDVAEALPLAMNPMNQSISNMNNSNDSNVTNSIVNAQSPVSSVISQEYTVNTLATPFYGVYYGHSALPLSADTLYYLTSNAMSQYIVTSYSSGKPIRKPLYDMEKAYGKDAYEMFLSGSEALLTIENPNAATTKELVVFRDSFASSLAPLLASDYAKITLIDIRYMQSSAINQFVSFKDQDVLFLYSTLLLNNSTSLR